MSLLKHRDICLFVHVSDGETHLLLGMFYEMNCGLRDAYFLLLIKMSAVSILD